MVKTDQPVVSTKQRDGKKQTHPNSLANLKKIQKGEVKNPNGPPVARLHLMRHICKFAEMVPKELNKVKVNSLSMSQKAALCFVKEMSRGDWRRIKEMLDRELGKPTENLNINSNVEVKMTNEDAKSIVDTIKSNDRLASVN